MYINLGPYSRLLRVLSIPRLFALAAALLGLLALCYVYVPVRVLRPAGPLLGIAGGVGVAALVFAVARLFALGGRAGIAVGLVFAVALAVAGASTWYGLSVAQPHARGACYAALRPASYDDAAAERERGRALIDGPFFRIAQRLRPDPSILEDCFHDEPDEVRRARGLCPRVPRGDERCRCGLDELPRADCAHPQCVLSRDGARLACD